MLFLDDEPAPSLASVRYSRCRILLNLDAPVYWKSKFMKISCAEFGARNQ
ncbi:hypothetical protein BSIN_2160 [Burkholderia singularis]|uniref:Uncharacterized protein n=1 Tax=Burkholderia singularis TaxID=1503053 RepID=A0A238H130_9BURK|nr:hypothetical protein BSIN_2160 [Burkholderia singularis]